MFPTRAQAFSILMEAEKRNPGPWVQHSICVANCAVKIASICDMNARKAYILGLLHDIGRKFGVTHFAHVVDGYKYMMELGYNESARICLTHSFPTQSMDDYIGEFDVTENVKNIFSQLLNNCQYNDYDRLIQLCDCLAGVEIMEMGKRMGDVAERYGYYPENKRIANFQLKEYFENKSGENIYKIITNDKSLWTL